MMHCFTLLRADNCCELQMRLPKGDDPYRPLQMIYYGGSLHLRSDGGKQEEFRRGRVQTTMDGVFDRTGLS